MASTLKVERGKLQAEYARLRAKILDYYYHIMPLIGPAPGIEERRLPPKLGHWNERHSDIVRTVAPHLSWIVQRIEELLERRAKAYIQARHAPLRRGDNFRRKGKGTPKGQLNPGEWPPRYR
jgi:hypothetical protein